MPEARRAAEPGRIVRCPGCGGRCVYTSGNPYRPFCGERCRLADLGAWSSEGYRLDSRDPVEGGGDEDPPATN